jgi:polysaccharide biosynthesis/export protein
VRFRSHKASLFSQLPLLGALIVAVLSSSACRSAPYVWVQNVPPEPAAPGDGRIVVGDVVDVRVFGQDSLSTHARVREDGSITMPLVGQVPMAGLRPAEVSDQLAVRLQPFVNTPHVTVVIQESQVSVTAVGEIKTIGILVLEAPATVLQALAKAGGMTDFADRDGIYVLRSVGDKTKGKSKTLRIRFKYDSLVHGEAAATNFRLKSGDVLIVE